MCGLHWSPERNQSFSCTFKPNWLQPELNLRPDRSGQNRLEMPPEREQNRTSLWARQCHDCNVYKRELPDWSSMWQDVRIYVYPDSYSDGIIGHSTGCPYNEQFLYGNIKRVAVNNPYDANCFCMPIHTISWSSRITETTMAVMNDNFRKRYAKYPH